MIDAEAVMDTLGPHQFNPGEIWQVFSSPLRVHARAGTYMILNVEVTDSIMVEHKLDVLNLLNGKQDKISYIDSRDWSIYKRLDNAPV
jgi:hypothetical protein